MIVVVLGKRSSICIGRDLHPPFWGLTSVAVRCLVHGEIYTRSQKPTKMQWVALSHAKNYLSLSNSPVIRTGNFPAECFSIGNLSGFL